MLKRLHYRAGRFLAMSWITEWRYHGFAEPFYGFEAFRTHLITTGLRVSR